MSLALFAPFRGLAFVQLIALPGASSGCWLILIHIFLDFVLDSLRVRPLDGLHPLRVLSLLGILFLVSVPAIPFSAY